MRGVGAASVTLLVTPEGAGILPEEATDELWSLDIARALERHYPGHPWVVGFQGGALIVRHMQIADAVMLKTGRQGFGSVLPPHRQGTRKEALEAAVRHGGELLETFGMPRGSWREECPPRCPNWQRGKSSGFT